MIFTIWYNERYKGAEICCDWCNKYNDTTEVWWYQRYDIEDLYPSNFVCDKCKESVE